MKHKSRKAPDPFRGTVAPRKKRFPWLRYVLLLLLGLVLYAEFQGPSGVLNILQLEQRNQSVGRQIDSVQALKADLELQVKRLRNDTSYLEMVARKELGMARPHEKVFRFVPQEQAADEPEHPKPEAP